MQVLPGGPSNGVLFYHLLPRETDVCPHVFIRHGIYLHVHCRSSVVYLSFLFFPPTYMHYLTTLNYT